MIILQFFKMHVELTKIPVGVVGDCSYGAEDMEALGMSIRQTLFKQTILVEPPEEGAEEMTLTPLQRKLQRKLGKCSPFSFQVCISYAHAHIHSKRCDRGGCSRRAQYLAYECLDARPGVLSPGAVGVAARVRLPPTPCYSSCSGRSTTCPGTLTHSHARTNAHT